MGGGSVTRKNGEKPNLPRLYATLADALPLTVCRESVHPMVKPPLDFRSEDLLFPEI